MLNFKIEQIALAPRDKERAMRLLARIGIFDWTEDTVAAKGAVHGEPGNNTAELAFNYDAIAGKELEVLNYTSGPNWIADRQPLVSHLGMHCSESELNAWKRLFEEEGVAIAQEVWTESHTNPFLTHTGRRYHYCIFDTAQILGVDLKFIVRRDTPEQMSLPL